MGIYPQPLESGVPIGTQPISRGMKEYEVGEVEDFKSWHCKFWVCIWAV